MAPPRVCQVLRLVWPAVVLHQLSFTLFITALQMVVRDRTANTSDPDPSSRENRQQRSMADFFMTFNLITQLVPMVPAMLLARASDRGWRRLPVALPLCGFLVQTLGLLLVLSLGLPLQTMFGAAALLGLSGEFSAFWPGVMTLTSLRSSVAERSKKMIIVEMLYGFAGLVGSLCSGHLFLSYGKSLGDGTLLLIVSSLLYLAAIFHSTVLLQVHQVPSESDESTPLIINVSSDASTSVSKNMVNMILLMSAAILYNSAVGGAVDILGIFVLKEPLGWDATMVGYGNTFGCGIFFTSFVGLMVFRRCAGDTTLILMGLISFASGMYVMSFVASTWMFFVARSITMLALIPMPTIRSMLSQQVPESSLGITLTLMQTTMRLASLAYLPAFTRIYQSTLDWYPGFVFLVASMLTVLAMVPVSVVGCRSGQQKRHDGGQAE